MHDKSGATIGALAETAGVNVETIRFYQRKGLMPEPEKPYGSIRRYGAATGSLLAIRRLARCHPWGGHGHDPVPPARKPPR